MSHDEKIEITAHPNIYNGKVDRELEICFSIPEKGTNKETGLLILVPGFGGNIESNVYVKMRKFFADLYNLVTIQCNYFGSKYMQDATNINFKEPVEALFSEKELELINKEKNSIFKIMASKNKVFDLKEELDETVDNFNDMGFMQAIDIITAIKAIKIILNENNFIFDDNRLIGYGHSHGAYLLHLSNILSNSFSYIIDNSAWIEPNYLHSSRFLKKNLKNSRLNIEFKYLAQKIIKNKNNLNLFTLYKEFDNQTQIIAFQGYNDTLVDYYEKEKLINQLNNSILILVDSSKVDNIKFYSTEHGLDADFLELFSYALRFESKEEHLKKENRKYFRIGELNFSVDNSKDLPLFNII